MTDAAAPTPDPAPDPAPVFTPVPAPVPAPVRHPARWPAWLPHAVALALIVALISGLAGLSLWLERERQHERAAQAAENVVRLLEAQVADVFSRSDAALQALRQRHARLLVAAAHNDGPTAPRAAASAGPGPGAGAGLDAPELVQVLALQQTLIGDLSQLLLVDASGAVRAGLRPGDVPRPSLGERADFRRVAEQAGDELVISGPRREQRGGAWVMHLMRPLRDAQGRFVGAVLGELPVRRFAGRFVELDLGARGAATLRGSDLALIFREPWPGDESALIGNTEVSRQLREVLQRQPLAGSYTARTQLDGIERVNAYRRVRGYPFTVIVGLATADFEAEWNGVAVTIVALLLLSIAAVAFATRALYRLNQRRLDDARLRIEAIVQYSRDAILSKSLDGRITSWNPGATTLYGHTEAEMVGRPISLLLPAERLHEEAEIMARIGRGEVIEAFDTVRLHRNGRRVPVSVSVAPVYDAAGVVVGASSIARDITQQKAMEEEIRGLAFVDALTGLPNRRLLLDRLAQALVAARRGHGMGALLFVDLDEFKLINDRHGHEAGDRLLIDVARRLRAAVRQSDTVARLGGDEFVVVCNNLGPDAGRAELEMRLLTEKVEAAIAHDVSFGNRVFHCRASVGSRLFDGQNDLPEALLAEADEAMYVIKARHRDDGTTAYGGL